MSASCTDTQRIARLERRVINAAMKLADAGGGFIFKDDRTVSDVRRAMTLETACATLRLAKDPKGKQRA